jgi:predicted nuclease with TOPRIM domain
LTIWVEDLVDLDDERDEFRVVYGYCGENARDGFTEYVKRSDYAALEEKNAKLEKRADELSLEWGRLLEVNAALEAERDRLDAEIIALQQENDNLGSENERMKMELEVRQVELTFDVGGDDVAG